MNINKRKLSVALLLLGMVLLLVGFATGNTVFSWAAFFLTLLSLVLSGRWLRPRRK